MQRATKFCEDRIYPESATSRRSATWNDRDHLGKNRITGIQSLAAALFVLFLSPLVHAEGTIATPDYRISPEDVLEISVWKEPDLQRQVIVRPDGGISFPLAGDVEAAGLTTPELEAAITQRLETYIPDAMVTVSVVELRGLRIYVSGKVRNPSQFTVGRYVDVLQAITLAGGLTPFADEGNIQVIRRTPDGERIFKFDYSKVKRGRNLEQNIMLQSDDVVVVP